MYISQIDDIIDHILDSLYVQILSDKIFTMMIEQNKINFIEYRDSINKFISDFTDNIDVIPIQEIIADKKNILKIIDIIKRYIAYYYFLFLAYYYSGTISEFRNNLIQYSKFQETSTFNIRNFFDTENNYQVIKYFKIIKDVSKLLLMTELQKKSINRSEFKDAIDFLNDFDKNYIESYLLEVVIKNDEENVQINVHNLIKTIVFVKIYQKYDRNTILQILNDIEENETEFTYIDIVVNREEYTDYENIRQVFLGEKEGDILARQLYDLMLEYKKIQYKSSIDKNNTELIKLFPIIPVVDDFLRYHRDSEVLELDNDKGVIIPTTGKNVQLALLLQQRKKKENTKAQIIVSKLDSITDFYSSTVRNNIDLEKEISKFFTNPFSYRKAVLTNYLEEIKVFYKILNQGRRAIENNEYFLELREIIINAYFNFRDFKKYGTSIIVDTGKTIDLLRYSNIESINTMTNLEVEMRSISGESIINTVGLSIIPLNKKPAECIRKNNLVDIRNVEFHYVKKGKNKIMKSENGFDAYLKFIKYCYIETISINLEVNQLLFNDLGEINKMNEHLVDKLIYWIYDPEKDIFDTGEYENYSGQNQQDRIKLMNSIIYLKIEEMLRKKLNKLINSHLYLDTSEIQKLILIFTRNSSLKISEDEQKELLIKYYLYHKEKKNISLVEFSSKEKIPLPIVNFQELQKPFVIRINMINPRRIEKYEILEMYSKSSIEETKEENHCQHENEWNRIAILKSGNLNKYNIELSRFIEKFVIKSNNFDFICKVCGQLLPMKEYYQDGSFDGSAQRFVTAYIPIDIPLEDISEYRTYSLIIKYLDALIHRFSLITSVTMLMGTTSDARQKRKAMIKSIIDIMIKHNSVNIAKKIDMNERLDFYSKKFNIDKDLDSVYFFELDNSIIDFNDNATANVELSKLKYNNMILYFILVFISELNGNQITMMSSDKKIGNIYVYLNYGSKLFDNLLIKKNINDNDTVPITNYPVLCYLIYIISYLLIQYRLWNYQSSNAKKFNPVFMKIIINSLVDLFNSIMIDSGKMQQDYIYSLITGKLYSQLNNVFNNNDIINVIKRNQIAYSSNSYEVSVQTTKESSKVYSIENPIATPNQPTRIPTFKIGDGIMFPYLMEYHYPKIGKITDVTNCPQGSYHNWDVKGLEVICTICGENIVNVQKSISRLDEAYYYNLNKIAKKRCLQGTFHNFEGKNFSCSVCGESKDKSCSTKELDILEDNLNKIEDARIEKMLENLLTEKRKKEELEELHEKLEKELIVNYQEEIGDKMYGNMKKIVDKLIKSFEKIFSATSTFDIDSYPVYLDNIIYIIEYNYDGSLLTEPIIVNQQDNIIHFKQDHPFFNIDVYYYTDNRTQIDVFYNAVTLQLLGYKERHKEYVRISEKNVYLKISQSIRERFITIGFDSEYIDVKNMGSNTKNILTSLIKEHIIKTKEAIDKFVELFNKIIYYIPTKEKEPEETEEIMESTVKMNSLIQKYLPLIANLELKKKKTFNRWNIFRNSFFFKKTIEDVNIPLINDRYIDIEIINHYDISSNIMMYYFINELIELVENQKNPVDKNNISQMIIGILAYVYEIYNTDKYRNSLEYKRFKYMLNASGVAIDIVRKGQTLVIKHEKETSVDDEKPEIDDVYKVEEGEDEMEDLKEEAEALDIEVDYFMEEDQDYAEQGDADY